MIWIRKHTSNPGVTDYYLETIGEAYQKLGEEVRYFIDWKDYKPKKNDMTVISTYYEAVKLYFKRKKFVWWVQGIRPEESYAVHKSKLRMHILNRIEWLMIRKTVFPIFVSNAMKRHYEEKYHVSIKKYYVMPCCNDTIKKDSFFYENKYDSNVFCYAGSLDTWQCVDKALALYKKIEDETDNAKLLLLVRDKEKIEKMLSDYQIKNYEIDFVPIDKLPEKLKKVKYGFIIREDLKLNRVATPTKLMTYMGNGVIPIISECLEGLVENLNDTKYVIKLSDSNDYQSIRSFMDTKIDSEEVFREYQNVYNSYYEREMHIEKMMQLLPR